MCVEEMNFLLILQHLPPQIYNGLFLKDNTPYKINPNTRSILGREDNEFLGKDVKEVAFFSLWLHNLGGFFLQKDIFLCSGLAQNPSVTADSAVALKPIKVKEIALISLVWGLLASFTIIFQCKQEKILYYPAFPPAHTQNWNDQFYVLLTVINQY